MTTAPLPKISADQKINVINPATGQLIERLATTTSQALTLAIATAKQAQEQWAAQSYRARKKILKLLYKQLYAQQEQVSHAAVAEMGCRKSEWMVLEFLPILDMLQWWLKYGHRHHQSSWQNAKNLFGDNVEVLHHMLPRGIIGLTTNTYQPILSACQFIFPALLAGNAIVWRPAPQTAYQVKAFAQIVCAVLPEGLFTVVQGSEDLLYQVVNEVDAMVLSSELTQLDQYLSELKHRHLPFTLLYPCRHVHIVRSNADLTTAAQGIMGGLVAGVATASMQPEVIFVAKSNAGLLQEALQEQNFVLPAAVLPLLTQQELAEVNDFLALATQEGCRLRELNTPSVLENTIKPLLLEDMPSTSALLGRAVKAPLLLCVVYQNFSEVEQALRAINVPLAVSFWGDPNSTIADWLTQLPVVKCSINQHILTTPVSLQQTMHTMTSSHNLYQTAAADLTRLLLHRQTVMVHKKNTPMIALNDQVEIPYPLSIAKQWRGPIKQKLHALLNYTKFIFGRR